MQMAFMDPPRVVDIDGTKLAYTDSGNGTPLVLIHGSLCDYRYWAYQVRALREDFRVIVPSLRGYWPNDATPPGPHFSITQHAHDIVALLERLDAGPAHWLGHSRGGRVALEAALLRPDVVRTLLLADPGLRMSSSPGSPVGADALVVPTGARPQNDFRAQAARLIAQGMTEEGLALFVDHVSGANTWSRMVPWFRDMACDNALTLVAQAAEPAAAVRAEQLTGIDVPALLIGGALSPSPYALILDVLQEWLPDVQRVEIAGSSHGMNIGNPRAFNRAVGEFLVG